MKLKIIIIIIFVATTVAQAKNNSKNKMLKNGDFEKYTITDGKTIIPYWVIRHDKKAHFYNIIDDGNKSHSGKACLFFDNTKKVNMKFKVIPNKDPKIIEFEKKHNIKPKNNKFVYQKVGDPISLLHKQQIKLIPQSKYSISIWGKSFFQRSYVEIDFIADDEKGVSSPFDKGKKTKIILNNTWNKYNFSLASVSIPTIVYIRISIPYGKKQKLFIDDVSVEQFE